MRFNPPPNWPVEPGWVPEPGWEPPADWSEPPYGWQLWVKKDPATVLTDFSGDDPAEEPSPDAPEEPQPKKGPVALVVQNPIWTTIGALVGIIGLVVSITQIYQATRTPPVDLEVAALTIDAQQSLQGTLSNGEEGTRSIELTPIDITLQNKGGEPSLITRVDAEVVYFQQLRDCTKAESAPTAITTQYHLAIPMNDVEPADKAVSNEVRFEVKPGTADRMVLTLGPSTQPAFATTPMVMSAKIKLIHDDDQTMDVGTVSLVTTVGAATAQMDALAADPAPEARTCAKDNLEHLDTMFAIQATRSRVLDGLRSAYQRAAA